MAVYETLVLMVSFGTLVALIMTGTNKKK
ncbi:putative holin-like toxin [Tuberibacillus sp. Marseille-P3662]